MPRKKKVEHGVGEGVENFSPVVNSTLPDNVVLVFNQGISPLDLNFGRADLNQLVDKINEVIKKVNQ